MESTIKNILEFVWDNLWIFISLYWVIDLMILPVFQKFKKNHPKLTKRRVIKDSPKSKQTWGDLETDNWLDVKPKTESKRSRW